MPEPTTPTPKPPRKPRGPDKPETILARAIAVASGLSPAQRHTALELTPEELTKIEKNLRESRDAAIKKLRDDTATALDEFTLIRPVVEALDELPDDFANRLGEVVRKLGTS